MDQNNLYLNILNIINEHGKKEISIFEDAKWFEALCEKNGVICKVKSERIFDNRPIEINDFIISIEDENGKKEGVGYINFESNNIDEKNREIFKTLAEQIEIIENRMFNTKKNKIIVESHRESSLIEEGDPFDKIVDIINRIKYNLEIDAEYGLFLLNKKTNFIEFYCGSENLKELSVHRESKTLIADANAEREIKFGENIGLELTKELQLEGPFIAVPLTNEEALGVFLLGGREIKKMEKWKFKLLKSILRDISLIIENILMVDKLRKTAETDEFLGILTKGSIIKKIKEEINNLRSDKNKINDNFALIMVDLDNFKKFNDMYGHVEGDKLLQNFVYKIKSIKRRYDYLGRYGGDEFILFLKHTDSDGAKTLAKRILDECNKISKEVTCSIGVYVWDGSERDVEVLFRKVDEKLYLAKKSGKNIIVIDGMIEKEEERQIYEADLFNEFLRKKEEERRRYGIPYYLLKCKGEAEKILSSVRSSDIVGKIDDYIAVLLTNTGEHGAAIVEDRLRKNGINVEKIGIIK